MSSLLNLADTTGWGVRAPPPASVGQGRGGGSPLCFVPLKPEQEVGVIFRLLFSWCRLGIIRKIFIL